MRYRVKGTSVTVLSDETIVAGSCERFYITFEFDKSWDGYIKIATIRRGAVKFDRVLENNTCEIPWEVFAQSGVLQISVRGEAESGIHAPAFAPFKVIYGGAKGKDCADAPSPDVWQQLLAEIEMIAPHIGENGHWYVGETDTGVVAQGKQGDPGPIPVKGKDYYTDADKAEMVQAVLDALPNGDEVSY